MAASSAGVLATGNVKKGNSLRWMLPTTEAGLKTARTVPRRYELRRIRRFSHELSVGTRVDDRRLDEYEDLRKCLAFDAVIEILVWQLSLLARERPDDLVKRRVTRDDMTALCALAARCGFMASLGALQQPALM